ncbi:MAG: type VI secretion system protein TssA, partial [Casimicrobiaceae bacterium]
HEFGSLLDVVKDEGFLALERSSRGKEEQQVGSSRERGSETKPAEPPNWPTVIELAGALLDRTHDLRAVHLLARGLTNTQGLAGLATALGLARDLLDRYWDSVHPGLVFDGEADPLVRMNALAAFATPEGMLGDVRAVQFLKSAAFSVSMRDIENVLDRSVGASKTGVNADQLRAAIDEALGKDPLALGDAKAIASVIEAIQTTLLKHLEPALLPDFQGLLSLVMPIAALVEERRALLLPPADGATPGVAGSTSTATQVAVGIGELRSRDDALRALDRVCDYLGRNEPTNPAPLLIRRAQRIMTMPFIDIIRELAPDATKQVENIAGARSQT